MDAPKKPCGDCPFRKKCLPGWLGPYNHTRQIIGILDIGIKFECHEQANKIHQHNRDEGLDAEYPDAAEKAGHCAGALIFMNNSCRMSRDPEIAKLQEKAGTSKDVFANAQEMSAFHDRTPEQIKASLFERKEPACSTKPKNNSQSSKKRRSPKGNSSKSKSSPTTAVTGRRTAYASGQRKKR